MTSIADVELSNTHLLLRHWDPDSDDDVATWLIGVTDPEFTRWNTPDRTITTADDARQALERQQEERQSGTRAAFCIVDRHTSTRLGHVSIDAIASNMRRGRVGFWLLPAARGRHAAVDALTLASRWAFHDLTLHRLELYHAIGNEASCRIANRCGFDYEGTLRDHMYAAGDREHFRDAHLHARLATDPPSAPQ